MKMHFTAPVLRVEAALATLTLQTASGGFTTAAGCVIDCDVPIFNEPLPPPPPPPPAPITTSGGKNAR